MLPITEIDAGKPGDAFLILTVAGRARLAAARRRGRLGTPASGRHSPPKAGGGKDSPFRGGPLTAGISAFGGIRTTEWQTPFVAVRATCLRSVKADGKEPPVTLGVAVLGPTGRNAHDRSVCTPSPAKNAAALTLAWCRVIRAGFALPRVPAGGRLSKPFLPLRRWPYAISSVGGYVPRREPSRRLGSSPPRSCGPLCRPEAGVPSRPRHGAINSTRSRVHPRCRRPVAPAIHGNRWEVGVPYPHPVTSISAGALRVTGIPVTRLRCLGVRSGP